MDISKIISFVSSSKNPDQVIVLRTDSGFRVGEFDIVDLDGRWVTYDQNKNELAKHNSQRIAVLHSALMARGFNRSHDISQLDRKFDLNQQDKERYKRLSKLHPENAVYSDRLSRSQQALDEIMDLLYELEVIAHLV